MPISLLKTDSLHLDYITLVADLDAELRVMDGEEHAFYAQYNKSDQIKHVILAYENNSPVGCGALKKHEGQTVEIKRMFVRSERRGKGIATTILKGLEDWARDLGFDETILETGVNQPEAINLYKKCSYSVIPNYGQYIGKEASTCMRKKLLK